jgi:predicted GNAT family N-acyltransferase
MDINLLNDKPDFIPQIAKWYSEEWGNLDDCSEKNRRSTAALEIKLADYLNVDTVPLVLVATKNSELVAAAQLRFQENNAYPEDSHWLGGVYVSEPHRGNGAARTLIDAILNKAKQLGIRQLYLQTEDLSGGLYKKMGWQAVEKVKYSGVHVLVMQLDLIPISIRS